MHRRVDRFSAAAARCPETPAEVQRRERPRLHDRLNDLLQRALNHDRSLVLHSLAESDGSAGQHTIAVDQSNLLLCIGETISPKDELFVEFGRSLANGKRIIQDEPCIDALSRLGLLLGHAASAEGKRYLLLDGTKIARVPRPTQLRLSPGRGTACP